jgi:DNA-binding CsgD family transcriptional regulator
MMTQSKVGVPVTSENTDDIAVRHLFRSPIERLQRVLEHGEVELDRRRHELAEVRHALLQLASEAAQPESGRLSPVWQLVSAEMAAPMLREFVERTEAAEGMVRSCVLTLDVGPGLEEANIRQAQDLLVGGRLRLRTLYPLNAMDTPTGRAWVQSWAAVGEEQRVSQAPPSDFAVFGEEAVMAVSEWGNASADYVLIREPMIVAAFTALFDRAYARALPVTVDVDDDDADLRLMRLLGLGLKDESIARYLGCSLRTVRRRVAHLMDVHGAQTRFQLGVAAAREDLVVVPPRGA